MYILRYWPRNGSQRAIPLESVTLAMAAREADSIAPDDSGFLSIQQTEPGIAEPVTVAEKLHDGDSCEWYKIGRPFGGSYWSIPLFPS